MLTCLFQHCKFIIYPEVILLTHLQPMFHFYASRKQRFSDVFRGCRSATLVEYGLNKNFYISIKDILTTGQNTWKTMAYLITLQSHQFLDSKVCQQKQTEK